jgi:hypothetical protein
LKNILKKNYKNFKNSLQNHPNTSKTQHQFFGIMKHEESDRDLGSGFVVVQ